MKSVSTIDWGHDPINAATRPAVLPNVVQAALQRPSGARFYRCALQVNPYAYVQRHPKGVTYPSEEDYNMALLDALQENGIEVIAITDHYRVKTGTSLAKAARERGIHVMMGFEASCKDGVHMLCLFDPDEDIDRIDRFIGACDVHDDTQESPTGQKDCDELLTACAEQWGGICVAAHVCSNGGLLATLSGQSAIRAWKHRHLHVCSLPGSVDDAPENYRPILKNHNPDYERDWPVAVLNAGDISSPAQAAEPGASCWIKMSSVSVEGLRQAFLDPESRIRLTSDAEPEDHSELLAICWEGGFLDESSIHFNDNLNVMIGGRGTGKSTIIESIRFVLDCRTLGEEAAKQHKAFVAHVLGAGAKVSLLLRSHTPSPRIYLVERTVGNAPAVKDVDGNLTELMPADIAGEVEIFGQHEISELARSPERLTGLLDRFVDRSDISETASTEIKHRLEDTRAQIVEMEKALTRIDEQLAALPGLHETLKRYKDLGLDKRLKDKRQLVTEEATLDALAELISDISDVRDGFDEHLPIDLSRLEEEKIGDLGGAGILRDARPVFEKFQTDVEASLTAMDKAVADAKAGLADICARWNGRRDQIDEAHQQTLRDLKKEGIDGNEYTELLRKIEQLEPKGGERVRLQARLEDAQKRRRKALKEWEDLKAAEFRALERAAKRVSKKLSARVEVRVTAAGDRSELEEHIRSLGGRVADTINALKQVAPLSTQALAQACRDGKDALVSQFTLPASQAERLAAAGSDFIMGLEELDLPATTIIRLNVAKEGVTPVWKELKELSTGQKATAVLLLLLLESSGSLVVDQPEDDLDNRFITEGVVPQIKKEKRRRQFIFATHNANIPVLGDAELIAALIPTQTVGSAEVHLPDENLGSIDLPKVRELVEETLEGGKAAFEMRRLKYGF